MGCSYRVFHQFFGTVGSSNIDATSDIRRVRRGPIYRARGVVGWWGNAVGRKGGRNKLRPYIQRFCIFVRIFKYKQTIALPIKCATPLWMLERRNIAFGMGHQAKDVAL